MRKHLIAVACIIPLYCSYPETYVPEVCDTSNAGTGLDIVVSLNTLQVDDTTQARCFIIQQDGTRREAASGVEWTTDNPLVLEVSPSGLVMGLSAGTACIQAEAAGFSVTRRILVERPPDYSGILISEVYYDPDVEEESLEFIEVVNTTSEVRDIGGLSIIDGSSKSTPFIFPSGTKLDSNEYAVVARSSKKFFEIVCYMPDFSTLQLSLNNSGEAIFLMAPDGTWVDQVYIKGGTTEFTAPDIWCASKLPSAPNGQSIYRIFPDDTNTCSDWSAGPPTPGSSTEGYANLCN